MIIYICFLRKDKQWSYMYCTHTIVYMPCMSIVFYYQPLPYILAHVSYIFTVKYVRLLYSWFYTVVQSAIWRWGKDYLSSRTSKSRLNWWCWRHFCFLTWTLRTNFDEKAFHDVFPKVISEYTKKCDPHLPSYYYTGPNDRYNDGLIALIN